MIGIVESTESFTMRVFEEQRRRGGYSISRATRDRSVLIIGHLRTVRRAG